MKFRRARRRRQVHISHGGHWNRAARRQRMTVAREERQMDRRAIRDAIRELQVHIFAELCAEFPSQKVPVSGDVDGMRRLQESVTRAMARFSDQLPVVAPTFTFHRIGTAKTN